MAEKFTVEINNRAENDLDGVVHYLMSHYSHGSAQRAVEAIYQAIDKLSTFPEARPIYHGLKSKRVYRYIIAKKVHRLIFYVEVNDLRVIVVKIRHVRADKSKVIRELEEE